MTGGEQDLTTTLRFDLMTSNHYLHMTTILQRRSKTENAHANLNWKTMTEGREGKILLKGNHDFLHLHDLHGPIRFKIICT